MLVVRAFRQAERREDAPFDRGDVPGLQSDDRAHLVVRVGIVRSFSCAGFRKLERAVGMRAKRARPL